MSVRYANTTCEVIQATFKVMPTLHVSTTRKSNLSSQTCNFQSHADDACQYDQHIQLVKSYMQLSKSCRRCMSVQSANTTCQVIHATFKVVQLVKSYLQLSKSYMQLSKSCRYCMSVQPANPTYLVIHATFKVMPTLNVSTIHKYNLSSHTCNFQSHAGAACQYNQQIQLAKSYMQLSKSYNLSSRTCNFQSHT